MGLYVYVIFHTILPSMQSSHFVDRAGAWQAKMASIEFWTPRCNVQGPVSMETQVFFSSVHVESQFNWEQEP